MFRFFYYGLWWLDLVVWWFVEVDGFEILLDFIVVIVIDLFLFFLIVLLIIVVFGGIVVFCMLVFFEFCVVFMFWFIGSWLEVLLDWMFKWYMIWLFVCMFLLVLVEEFKFFWVMGVLFNWCCFIFVGLFLWLGGRELEFGLLGLWNEWLGNELGWFMLWGWFVEVLLIFIGCVLVDWDGWNEFLEDWFIDCGLIMRVLLCVLISWVCFLMEEIDGGIKLRVVLFCMWVELFWEVGDVVGCCIIYWICCSILFEWVRWNINFVY